MAYAFFDVAGPYEIPVTKLARAKHIETGCREFWRRHVDIQDRKGCYIFAIKAGKGYTPIYVGKATKSFHQECFAVHKTGDHYNRALANMGRGTPVMTFLVAEKRRGKVNARSVEDLETTLIRWARDKNPHLSNKAKRGVYTWGINGVEGGKPGKPSKAAGDFKKIIGYDYSRSTSSPPLSKSVPVGLTADRVVTNTRESPHWKMSVRSR
jgi:hypothetical protein